MTNVLLFCLQTRQVFLGLCLPGTCDRISLMSMLRASADRVEREGNSTHRRSSGPKIHIVALKPIPSNDYSAWTDPKVYVLGQVFSPSKKALRISIDEESEQRIMFP